MSDLSNAISQLTYYDIDAVMKPVVDRIAVGDDPRLQQQLFAKSRQANILKYTPKDVATRFGDQAMFDAWKAKGKDLHWLLAADNDLAGVLWYSQAPMPVAYDTSPQPQETFGIRIYEGYAGHGLARPFMLSSLKVHVQEKAQRNEPLTGLWLQTDIDNAAAVAAYAKFGYQEISRDAARITMILTVEDIAQLLQNTKP